MDIQNFLDWGVEYFSEYILTFTHTLKRPVLGFHLRIIENTNSVLLSKKQNSITLNPRLIAFVIISIFIGSTLNSIIPNRPSITDTVTTAVVTFVVWFVYSVMTYGVCKLLKGKGEFWETVSIVLQLLAVIYVVSNFCALIWGGIAQSPLVYNLLKGKSSFADFFLDNPIFSYYLIHFPLMLIYLPIAMGYIHNFGFVRKLLSGVIPFAFTTVIASLFTLTFVPPNLANTTSFVALQPTSILPTTLSTLSPLPTPTRILILVPTPQPLPTFNSTSQGIFVIDHVPPLPTATLSSEAILPENSHLLNQVRILDNRRGQEIRFTQDGNKLIVLQDVLRVWEMRDQTITAELPIQTSRYSPINISPNGQILAIGNYESEGDLQIWSLATKEMLMEYKGGEQVRHLSFNTSGDLLAVGRVDGDFIVLDMNSGNIVTNKNARHVSNCEGLSFNPITGQLAVNNDETIDVWDNTIQYIEYSFPNPDGCEVSQIEYSPNGEFLAAKEFWEQRVVLWQNGNYVTNLTHSNSDTIWKIAWSPNGRLLATLENTNPNQIVLWDVENRKIAQILEGYGDEIAFSPDGKYIVTQSSEGAIVILNLSTAP